MAKNKKHRNTGKPHKIKNELLNASAEPKREKKKVDEGPLPLGNLFTEKDRDFNNYKKGFTF